MAYNGRTGKQFDTSYGGRTPLTVDLTKDKSLAGFIKALEGQRVGARLLAAIPPIDGFGAARPEVGLNKSDTMVFYLNILEKVGKAATGKKQALPADVPAVVVEGGRPTGFKKTASTPATLTRVAARTSRSRATAPRCPRAAPSSRTTSARCTRRAPSSTRRGTAARRRRSRSSSVIKCWQNLLPGVPIGSRVVLECTAADAYGDSPPPGGKIKPGDALLFVVDVLDAH